ncbi:MAG TPA: hypothetical protein VFV85_03200 [Conexibacter sp.]|nr:hypothetical protein [Conexibacter sp.]
MAAPESRQSGSTPETVRDSRFAHALSAHQHRTAAALFALLVLVYLWPALVGGGVLAPLALLYQVPPWTGSHPADIASYFNPGLLDVTLSYYPWDVLARELIRSGTFPAWNPHALAGTPFFANPEVGWLSPFNVPMWILPLNYALGLVAALKLWVAGFGGYLLARELRLGFWPGLLAGVSFALCAFNIEWLSHSAFTAVSVLLPWLLLLAERIVRRGRGRDGLALAVVAAVAFAGGHPGTQLHVLSGTVLYALLRAGLATQLPWGERLRRLGLIAAGCALGALLMAVVLLPAQQASLGSAGAAARHAGGTEEFHGAKMPFAVLRTALFPEWWGRPSELVAGPSVFNERTFYAGTVALLLALVGLIATWRAAWRRTLPFAVLGVLGIAVALETPGLHALVDALPLFDAVQNQRILLWFLLAISVLAAFGLEAVLEADARTLRRIAWGVGGGALLVALAGVASIHFRGDALGRAVGYMAHRRSPVSWSGLELASVLWWTLLAAALVAVVLLLRRNARWAALAGALVVLIAAFDMLHFAHGYQSMGPASKAVPPRTPAIAFLQRHASEGRIAGVRFAVANDWSTVYGLRDARGYDAPQPSLRFYRLWHTIEPEQRLHTLYTFSSLEASSLAVLGVLGTRWIAAEPGVHARLRNLRPVYRGKDATVFENALAMPRAIVARDVTTAGEEGDELVGVARTGFDPRTDAVVRRDEVGADAPAGAGGGRVRVVGERDASVTLRATLPRRGLVVLDDAWAPGWHVSIDGHPARALQADMVLRGVVVPAGTHEVVWSYRVPGLRAGAALSVLGLLIAAGWGGWLLLRRRRRFPLARGR